MVWAHARTCLGHVNGGSAEFVRLQDVHPFLASQVPHDGEVPLVARHIQRSPSGRIHWAGAELLGG